MGFMIGVVLTVISEMKPSGFKWWYLQHCRLYRSNLKIPNLCPVGPVPNLYIHDMQAENIPCSHKSDDSWTLIANVIL